MQSRPVSRWAYLGMRHPIVAAFAGIMTVVAGIIYLVMVDAQRSIIQHEAVKIAEVVARQALAARSVYSAQVVEKLKGDGFGADMASAELPGHVPLPAQFLKDVGRESSKNSDGLYSYRPISLWNLESSQGLVDDFQRWGWQMLSKQDSANPTGPQRWEPVWRFEAINGAHTLRYLRADPASGPGCVNCHNAYEMTEDVRARRNAAGVSPGKQWRQHQLLGAIEVNVPIDRVEALAAAQTRQTLLLVLSIAALGLAAAGFFAIKDISNKQRLSEHFARQARFDALTLLTNRSYFADLATEQIRHCISQGGSLAMLFIDLDRFKNVNDSLGHEAGDQVLKIVAARLIGALRTHDIVARHSGDEFTVLLTQLHAQDDLNGRAEDLLQQLSQPIVIGERTLYLTASIGISRFGKDGNDVATLLKHADTAMYRAKQQGRNAFHFYTDEMNIQARESLDLGTRLRQALEREQFVLHYQPRVRATDGRIIGVEALLRWNDPENGLIAPGRFLPFAEDSGLIEPIGHWVMRTALAQRAEWSFMGIDPFRVSVNVSPRQFQAANFLEQLDSILAEDPSYAGSLELEITEGMLVNDPERVASVLEQCHRRGIALSLDDFGTGYSSLSYLKRFPFDCLKIDKSFVDDLPDDPNDRVLSAAIVGLAHSLQLKVVAEGVETLGQSEFLSSLGCDAFQGYLYSRPVEAARLEPMLMLGRIALPDGGSMPVSKGTRLPVASARPATLAASSTPAVVG